MNKPEILECTLRDGSYAINFQFTEMDTRNIVSALDDIGFKLIEVGHGIGLGASEKTKMVAAETDESYMKIAAESVKTAQWGMFCIPGIAELHHIDLAADYNMNFIRIGTNIEDYQRSKPFIEKAKKHGMFVCSNFMKSYCSSPAEFANYALNAMKYGSDLIYLVDSAGGMLPDEISQYIDAARQKSPDIRLGFHGHHNLGLGVANALKATELGVDIIDTSLQGFGRSAGNTPTEQFLCTLLRTNIDLGIDPIKVMDLAEQYIYPLINKRGLDAVDVISGYALFHSSYMPIIEKFSTLYRVDPRRLIVAVCSQDKVNAPGALVEEKASELAEEGKKGSWKAFYARYYGGEQNT